MCKGCKQDVGKEMYMFARGGGNIPQEHPVCTDFMLAKNILRRARQI